MHFIISSVVMMSNKSSKQRLVFIRPLMERTTTVASPSLPPPVALFMECLSGYISIPSPTLCLSLSDGKQTTFALFLHHCAPVSPLCSVDSQISVISHNIPSTTTRSHPPLTTFLSAHNSATSGQRGSSLNDNFLYLPFLSQCRYAHQMMNNTTKE